MSGENDKETRRKERTKLAEELLRDVPKSPEAQKTKSRWIAADEAKPDPRSVY